MDYCPKCGNKVDDTMTFCPRCGASLKAGTTAQPGTPTPEYYYRYRYRHEKEEKGEKNEKGEKAEKYEKRAGGYAGLVIAGLLVLFFGLLALANAITGFLNGPVAGAVTVIIVGMLIVAAGIYYSTRSRSRNPAPT